MRKLTKEQLKRMDEWMQVYARPYNQTSHGKLIVMYQGRLPKIGVDT